ncbi:MAG: LysR family transcriptional regulator [Gammaproteobacteria bacterium]|jgi:DNA-binding transcriptional LysR family regulator|nr:LysR family transcriptional regulator [Gammaproteobacteria bacterium]
MDIELLRTFLEVHQARHFGRAAVNLSLSQSTVSARIRLLEDQIGAPLFTRDRNDIRLTSEGQSLVPFAENIVTSWHRARQEVLLGRNADQTLLLGATPNLWDVGVSRWLQTLYGARSNLLVTAESAAADVLLQQLLNDALDLIISFESPRLKKLEVRELETIPLLLVASRPGLSVEDALSDYVLVEWGSAFLNHHARTFSSAPPPRLRVSLGSVARDFLLACGGATYLAQPGIEAELAAGRLHLVAGAPLFKQRVFAGYASKSKKRELISATLALLPQSKSSSAV